MFDLINEITFGGIMKRREIREAAFILLFEQQFHDCDFNEIIDSTVENFGLDINDDIIKLTNGVLAHVSEIDSYIEKYSPKRKINRIPKANMAILRISMYELLYDKNVPEKVSVNEAVEIAKKFTDKTDSAFINAVLGSLMLDRREQQ